MPLRTLLALSAAGALAACASSGPIPAAEFTCTNNERLLVSFPKERAVVVQENGYSVTLPQQISGSGFRYADDRHELRGKGNEITWTIGNQRPLFCKSNA